MNDTDKKLILEWEGWERETFRDHGYEHTKWRYYYKDRTEPPYCESLETDTALDLNHLFKYAVPKLYEQGYYYDLFQWNSGQHKVCIKQKTEGWAEIVGEAVDKDPEEAFGQALLPLIKEKN